MYSSETDAHSHVNSHMLRRITCVTCQTHICTIHSLFHSVICLHLHVCRLISNKVYVPHLSTVGVEVSKVRFSHWYLVPSTLFALTYHPCIRSSLHINFTSLANIPFSNEDYVSITHVTLKAPSPELHIERIDLKISQQQTTYIVLSGNVEKKTNI